MDRSTAPASRPTIHTVAERAGVSKSLVSLVLRGSPKVSPDRRAAVQRAIAELGYRPNIAARDLRQRRSRTVGVLLNDIRHPWFVDLLDGLTDALAEQGRQLLLNSGRLDRARDDTVPRTLADLGVEGMVLVGTQAGSPALAEVAQAVPTVAVGWRDLDLPRVDTVGNDDLLGGALATRHLIELGHRRIAHIAGNVPGSTDAVAGLRRRGYEDTMREHGLQRHIRVETGDHTDDGGYRAAVRLLRSAEPPTAIFAVDDLTCLGAQAAAAELGVDVPGSSRWSATTTPSSPGCARSGSPASTASARRWAGSRPGRWPPGSTTPRAPRSCTCSPPRCRFAGPAARLPATGDVTR